MRGQLFGELALMGDQPRAASAKCLEETHFLVISRHDFDALLKSDLGKQKDETTGFLRRHVPGMSDLAEQSRFGKPHASYYFKEQSVPKGFLFVKQGEKTSERFWVLRKGVVEFWHCDPEARLYFQCARGCRCLQRPGLGPLRNAPHTGVEADGLRSYWRVGSSAHSRRTTQSPSLWWRKVFARRLSLR